MLPCRISQKKPSSQYDNCSVPNKSVAIYAIYIGWFRGGGGFRCVSLGGRSRFLFPVELVFAFGTGFCSSPLDPCLALWTLLLPLP